MVRMLLDAYLSLLVSLPCQVGFEENWLVAILRKCKEKL